jgi:predicted transposase YbfD/YdcC
MKSKLTSTFSTLTDPRSIRNRDHDFNAIVGIALLSGLAGIDSFLGIADYCEINFEQLSLHFDLHNGAISHDTFRKVFSTLNPEMFQTCFFEFTKNLADAVSGVIAIDGKTIRNSKKGFLLHMVSAWCEENQLVLAQVKTKEKSNEITVIPKLLELLNLGGAIVTIDAMGCQRSICEEIKNRDADYVIGLKANQKTLYEDVKKIFSDQKVLDSSSSFEENDKGHGRLEKRTVYSTSNISDLQKKHQWFGLQSINMVISKRTFTNHLRKRITTSEQRFYISSLPEDAKKICQITRQHWGIENKLHWRLDVVYNEDGACIHDDTSAMNMSTIRKWSLNILQKAKSKPEQSLKGLMRKNAMSLAHALKIVKKVFHA